MRTDFTAFFSASGQDAFVFIFKNFLCHRSLEGAFRQRAICSEFQSNIFDASDRHAVAVSVGVGQGVPVPISFRTCFKPQRHRAAGKLFNGIVAPAAAEAEDIIAAAAVHGVIVCTSNNDIAAGAAHNAVISGISEKDITAVVGPDG